MDNRGGLADDALNNLVNQFARPLDFLRELVQNSIDAGSSRVDVRFHHIEASGVMEVHVRDFGEGMDEKIIDDQLTRLFASSKEDDLTKIGKFGIGFTSIFAMRPELVRVRTGRMGQSWELLFHADRSFEKIPHPEPITGTHLTLFKRMASLAAEQVTAEARQVLTYWCEHSAVPITFAVGAEAEALGGAPSDDDPFGAFAAPVALPETVNLPFGLQEPLVEVRHADAARELVVGFTEVPRYGFYNGGLTLVSTPNAEVLGNYTAFSAFTFKIRDNRLEHTLTRDNVLRDARWRAAMGALRDPASAALTALLDACEAAALAGRDPSPFHRHLARLLHEPDWRRPVRAGLYRRRAAFLDQHGRPLHVGVLAQLSQQYGVVLVHQPGDRIEIAPDVPRVSASADTLALIHALSAPRRLKGPDIPFRTAPLSDWVITPDRRDRSRLPPSERALIEAAEALVAETDRRLVPLEVGDFGGAANPLSLPPVVFGPLKEIFLRRRSWFQLQWQRDVAYINRSHEHFQRLLAVSATAPRVAAAALAQLVVADAWVQEVVDGDALAHLIVHAGAPGTPGAPGAGSLR